MALPDHLIDKRIVQRSLASGKLDAEQYKQMLESLPDLSSQVAAEAAEDDGAPQPPSPGGAGPGGV